ncbi:MAG: hypothetical protein HY050_09780 [Actinobacteria bacterium]|nr:hypothetical protein [Actinomycetota bacterium]
MKKSRTKLHPRRRFTVALILLLVVTFAYVLGWSSIFTVKQIRVLGAPTASQSQLVGESIRVGEKMARLETRAVTNSLKKYTWLDRAQIDRNWLKGLVTIHVWTRTPVAAYQTQLIDRNGVLFDLPSEQNASLPRIAASNISATRFAVELLLQLPIDLRSNVTALQVQGTRSAVLTIRSSNQNPPRIVNVIWGDSTETDLKVRVFKALLALPENIKVETINVSAPRAPIVK